MAVIRDSDNEESAVIAIPAEQALEVIKSCRNRLYRIGKSRTPAVLEAAFKSVSR